MEDDVITFNQKQPEQKTENSDCSIYGFWVGSFKAFSSAFTRCFDLKGRTSRFDCWGFYFGYVLVRIFVGFSLYYLQSRLQYDPEDLLLFRNLFTLAMAWVLITVMVRRLHDVNMRGWWILISFVPFIVSFLKGNKEANRFGPAPVTNEKKALVAVLMTFCPVLGLFLFVMSVGIIAGYTKATKRVEAVKTIDQVQQIVTNVQTLFSSSGKYAGLNKPSLMYQVGVYGDEICGNELCSHPVNPYGGSLSMNIAVEGFTLKYDGIPFDACMDVLTKTVWSGYLQKFSGLSVNDEYFASPVQDKASSACKKEANTITWHLL